MSKHTIETAKQQGREAFLAGADGNPFDHETENDLFMAFSEGWLIEGRQRQKREEEGLQAWRNWEPRSANPYDEKEEPRRWMDWAWGWRTGAHQVRKRPMPKVEVGDGFNYCLATDVHACTVVAVSKSGKVLTLREDKATLLNGPTSGEPDALKVVPGGFAAHWSGTQRWAFEENPEGRTVKVSWRAGASSFKLQGYKANERGGWASPGRRHHYDYNY